MIFCNVLGLFYCNFPLEVSVLCVLVVVTFWLMGSGILFGASVFARLVSGVWL